MELMEQSGGDADKMTIRAIAEKAGVGVGLVNYHFQTKEHLIEICVQRIISKVIASFRPENGREKSAEERLARTAAQVFEFLFENKAVARISILADLAAPSPDSNSVKTMKGFASAAGGGPEEAQKQLMVFVLTCAMQAAFLGAEQSKAMTGYDLRQKAEREAFIKSLVGLLYRGDAV